MSRIEPEKKSGARQSLGDVRNDRKRNSPSLIWICSDRDGIAQTGPDLIGNSIVCSESTWKRLVVLGDAGQRSSFDKKRGGSAKNS